MNIKYDFTETGGFPLDEDVLNDMQTGALAIETAFANVVGPLAIISGCVIAGLNAGNGVVIINGEILPFVGGPIQTKVIIVQVLTNITYFDGTPRPSLITRHATFGDDGVQNNLWVNFRRNTSDGVLARLDEVWLPGDIKQIDCTIDYLNANFDGTGLGKNERLGWAISNGNNGTRNRGGKVSIQYDTTIDYANTLGNTGGEEKHTLGITEIPDPQVTLQLSESDDTSESSAIPFTARKTDDGLLKSGAGANPTSAGGDGVAAPHNNMQPYIITLEIQKL